MSTAESRRRWAHRMVTRCPSSVPLYGSAEWLGLPEGDVRKVAAVVRAAEAWATEGDELEALARLAHKKAEDSEYVERREAHRERWLIRRGRPSEAERAALAAELEAEWSAWARGDVA